MAAARVAVAVAVAAGADALFAAIDGGDVEQVRALVARDPACASARNPSGLSAVLAATYRHRADMVDALLRAAADLDVFDAAAVGDVARLAALLDEDPGLARAYAPDGFTPLALAAFFRRPHAVRLLVERGGDVGATARNAMAVQPLHAAVAGRDPDCVRTLAAAGADPNARQHGGWTPLIQAAAHGDVDIVEILVEAGADAGLAGEDGKTAASLAEDNGHEAVVARLRRLSPRR